MKRLDHQKELTPVVYGESSVKISVFDIDKNNICFRTHWHDRFEILRVMKGEMEVFIGDNSYIAPTNSLVIINPCQPHTATAGNEGAYYYVVSFDIDKFFNSSAITDKYLKPILERNVIFDTIIEDDFILAEVDMLISNYKINPLCTVANVYMVLGKIISKKLFSETQNLAVSEKFNDITNYINEHFIEDISLNSLAQKFGYNKSYLSRKFKENTGLTVTNYINILRLEKAQKMIRSTNNSISNIAYLCGFSDITYFSHIFKKHFGISPVNFKNNSNKKSLQK